MIEYLGTNVYEDIIRKTTMYFKVNNNYYGLTAIHTLTSGVSFHTHITDFIFTEILLDNIIYLDKKVEHTIYKQIIYKGKNIDLCSLYIEKPKFDIINYITVNIRKQKIKNLLDDKL